MKTELQPGIFSVNGVVVNIQAVNNRSYCFAVGNGYSVLGLTFSPVKGPEGNIEYLVYLEKSETPQMLTDTNIEELVVESHQKLDKGAAH